ncbi:MAG: NAD(P)(+) transhydrogenase (Re/Si-specific) subunit beta, partial [Cytophagaceae bacterium]|nr:NAD(P)(+) transhydrogenase (Re/Si-specific) subunit beta [Gemmatimonadaceae bacterium]
MNTLSGRELAIQVTYVLASIAFIVGIRGLTQPDKARRGIQIAAIGMLLAIIGTLVSAQILTYTWIAVGLAIGTIIGYPLGVKVPMTAMPQRIAIAQTFGASAATLVGVAEYHHAYHGSESGGLSAFTMGALGLEVMLGALTVCGSLIAFGKLQEILPGRPITFKGQNFVNLALVVAAVVMLVALILNPADARLFYGLIVLASIIGFSLVLPIGGADMPVVIALLNSYAGLASAATGFALGNMILIICGALDGASGVILSLLMSKAMNRSFRSVLFGAFGSEGGSAPTGGTATGTVRSVSVEDAAVQIAFAQKVIVVPGYGMAVAQAQHALREMGDKLRAEGVEVKYAIHPVAGRMPGHMNVLLAEANVPYDEVFELEDINSEFSTADVAFVIGANDVTNPAAKTDT